MLSLSGSRKTHRPSKRSTDGRRRPKPAATVPTPSPFGPAFLTQPILPIQFAPEPVDKKAHHSYPSLIAPQTPAEQQQAVDQFYTSLGHLADLYGFTPRDCRHMAYPLSIGLSYYSAVQQLKGIAPDVKLVIMATKSDEYNHTPQPYRATLVTVQERDDNWLVNIPVRPYHRMIREARKHRYRLPLLDSIFAVLYHKVDFPYCDGSSYYDQVLTYQDEGCDEWDYLPKTATAEERAEWETSEEVLDARETKKSIATIRRLTQRCKKRFDNPHHLDMFSTRISEFVEQPGHPHDSDLLQVAIRLLELNNSFPDHSFNAACNTYHVQVEENHDGTIFVDQTHTCVWSQQDEHYQYYRECLDSDIQCGAEDEHIKTVQFFDQPQPTDIHPGQQAYYEELLETLSQLGDILDQYDRYDPTLLSNIIPPDSSPAIVSL